MSRNSGFTLLEVMVSLAIFALLSVASYQFLRSLTIASDVTMSRAEQRWQLETGLLILEQDIRHMLARSITTGAGDDEAYGAARYSAAVTNRHQAFLELSRAGLPDKLMPEHHAPGRVVYQLEQAEQGMVLQRVVYDGLDITPATTAWRQQLLPALEAATLRFMGEDGAWRSAWPPASTSDDAQALNRLPVAVELAFTLRDQAPRQRVFSLR